MKWVQVLQYIDLQCDLLQIKLSLLEHGAFEAVKECVKKCIEMGHAWVAAAMCLELLRRGKIEVLRFFAVQHGGPVSNPIPSE